MIGEAERTFQTYQDKCDGIDKLYADLEKLSNVARDRQFQLFWANISVLGPRSIRGRRFPWWCRGSRTASRCRGSPPSCSSDRPSSVSSSRTSTRSCG
jgi:hypothetical protein